MGVGFGLGVVALRNLRRMGNLDEGASASTHEVTRLLQAWGSGDHSALERLMSLVYKQLHRLTHRYMAAEHGVELNRITISRSA